jgi:hypothetical protein
MASVSLARPTVHRLARLEGQLERQSPRYVVVPKALRRVSITSSVQILSDMLISDKGYSKGCGNTPQVLLEKAVSRGVGVLQMIVRDRAR